MSAEYKDIYVSYTAVLAISSKSRGESTMKDLEEGVCRRMLQVPTLVPTLAPMLAPTLGGLDTVGP